MTEDITHSSYKSNPLLRPVGVDYPYTKEEIEEFVKCSKDPIYFIENYIKVVHPDRGLTSLKLFDFQEEMVTSYWKNRKTICLAARQMGKCLFINTPITIRNKEYYEGKSFTITIGEFHAWQAFVSGTKEIRPNKIKTD